MRFLIGLKRYIWLVLFAILISSCFFTYVNELADYLLPRTELKLTITSPNRLSKGNQVWIYLIDGKEIEQNTFDTMLKTGEWSFMREEDGASSNTIIGLSNGGTITIPINKSCSGGISIWMQAYAASIDVETEDFSAHYDLYSEEGDYLQITPYEDHLVSIGIRAVVYCVLFVLITFTLSLIYKKFYSAVFRLKEYKYNYKYIVGAIFICTYIFDVLWYKHGIVNFNAFGDQPGYWEVGGVFATPNVTNGMIKRTIRRIPCFRGYGNFLFSFISQFIGNRLKIDSYIVYFVFPSLTAAFLFGYVMPKIYEVIHGKRVSITQIMLSYISFFIFYKGNLVSIDGDLPGMTFYLAGALFMGLLFYTGYMRYAVFSSMCFSLSLAIRTSYLIGVVLIVIISFMNIYKRIYKFSIQKIITFTAVFIFVFVSICTPQIYINIQRGHCGLFAYDKDGAYGTDTTTLLEQGVDYALRGWVTGYPTEIFDDQIHSIRVDAGYLETKEITMAQGFDAYAKKPLDACVAIAKRLFAFIDIKFNVTLPNESWHAHTKYYLFSTLNYLFLATAVFTLLNKKTRELVLCNYDLLFWGTCLLGPIAPMLAGRLEWRQGMLLYLFYLGYICAYCFFDGIADRAKRIYFINNKYLSFVTTFMFVCHAISLTMYN